MIILDTNVLSVFTKPCPEAVIQRWLDAQISSLVWTTSISIFEIKMRIDLLPPGKRREHLEKKSVMLIQNILGNRVLPFDSEAAYAAGALAANRKKKGINITTQDTQIAGIAISRHAALATRNLKDFSDLDLKIINPWDFCE